MGSRGTVTKSTPDTSNTELANRDVCPICSGAGYFRRDVPLGHPDFGRPIPCRCKIREQQLERLQALHDASNLGQLTRMTFDTFVPDGHGLNAQVQDNLRRAYAKAIEYAQRPQGWLIIKGVYGCGKTHLGAAIANYQVEHGGAVLFVVVPDLLDYLRATYAPNSAVTFDQRFESVRSVPLLVLDDLGAHSSTPWAQEKLYQVLNYRYNAQLPTVITTNAELEDLNPRMRSRMTELEWSSIVHILAPDYRGSAVFDQTELSSLGLHQDQTFGGFDLREHDPEADESHRMSLRRSLGVAKAYAEDPKDWLAFTGDYGCGKTHLAAAIANDRVDRGYPALFVVVPDLLDHLRATFSPNSNVGFDRRFSQVRTSALLVLDDLGTQSATPWAQEKLFQILDHRYNARLPTVITMARDADLDPRLKTRIFDISRCQVWEITAPSYRGGARLPQQRRRSSGTRRSRKSGAYKRG